MNQNEPKRPYNPLLQTEIHLVIFCIASDLPGNKYQPFATAGSPGSGEASGPADHPSRGQPSGQSGSVALICHLPPLPFQPSEDQWPGGEDWLSF